MLKTSLIQGPLHSEESLECSNGIFKSEGSGGFLLLQNIIPNLYPKLLHPAHGIDQGRSLAPCIDKHICVEILYTNKIEKKREKSCPSFCD